MPTRDQNEKILERYMMSLVISQRQEQSLCSQQEGKEIATLIQDFAGGDDQMPAEVCEDSDTEYPKHSKPSQQTDRAILSLIYNEIPGYKTIYGTGEFNAKQLLRQIQRQIEEHLKLEPRWGDYDPNRRW